MENWYLGGYYLINGPSDWWASSGKKTVHTVGCVSDEMLGNWCYKWVMREHNIQENNLSKQRYKLTDKKLKL